MPDTEEYRAQYWHLRADGRVECEVCPHHCRLKSGQRGRCFVRMGGDQCLLLTTYGRSSGFCVDPIEKKPLYHFLPGTAILSFGTAGCNLRCTFCQNWGISHAGQMETLAAEASPSRIARAARKLDCHSVAFTYNDPVIFAEYATDTAQACHEAGIRTVAVTAGYIEGKARKDFFEKMDAANVDLKAFTERFYRDLCGADLQTVLDTLVYIRNETNTWLEVTTLLIPGENTSEDELDRMTRWIVDNLGPDVPLHFSAYHPAHKMTDHHPTSLQDLVCAREIALKNGLRYVYTGNVRDEKSSSTYCHNCGQCVIGRDAYLLTGWALDERGCCAACGTACAGVFEPYPGSWGGGCLPVDITRY